MKIRQEKDFVGKKTLFSFSLKKIRFITFLSIPNAFELSRTAGSIFVLHVRPLWGISDLVSLRGFVLHRESVDRASYLFSKKSKDTSRQVLLLLLLLLLLFAFSDVAVTSLLVHTHTHIYIVYYLSIYLVYATYACIQVVLFSPFFLRVRKQIRVVITFTQTKQVVWIYASQFGCLTCRHDNNMRPAI